MAIGTATAIIGSAIIGGAVGLNSASQARNAAGKALDAQTAGNNKALDAQQANFDRIYGINQPFVQGGLNSYDALLRQFGVGGGGGAQPSGGGAPSAPRPATAPSSGGTVVNGQRYQTTFMDGTPTPPGTYIGPNDELLPIPGYQGGGTPAGAGFSNSPNAARNAEIQSSIGFTPSVEPPRVNSPNAGGAPSYSGGGGQGGVDGDAYFAANPDVKAAFDAEMADPAQAARLRSSGQDNPAAYSQAHHQVFGQNEGRQLPQIAPQPQAPPQTGPQVPQRPDAPAAPNMTRPDALAPPNMIRPTDPTRQDFGQRHNLTAPEVGAGPQFKFDKDAFFNDEGYKFRIGEATNAVNAGSAARGLLRSGGAVKELLARSSGIASDEYGNAFNRALQSYSANRGAYEDERDFGRGAYEWDQGRADSNYTTDRAFNDSNFESDRSRTDSNFADDRNYSTNLWNTNQQRNDNVFADDRSYATNMWQYNTERGDRNFSDDRTYATDRYDTNTNNLFRLTGVGLQAAGNVSGAGTNFANAATGIYGNQANAAGDAAYAKAGANSYAAGAIGNAAGNVFSYDWGGGSRANTNANAMRNDWSKVVF